MAKFKFAEIPEIVFIEGVPEVEQLGPFHLDINNRWTPGDITRASGWKPKIATKRETQGSASGAGLDYVPETGELKYDGRRHPANVDRLCKLTNGDASIKSNTFRIRILRPKAIFGVGAEEETRWPYVPMSMRFDPTKGRPWFSTARVNLIKTMVGGTDALPDVVVCLGGSYTGDFYCGEKQFFYVLGDPNNRPKFNNDSMGTSKFIIQYIKNLELINCKIGAQANHDTAPMINFYLTKCYQHDGEGQVNGIANPNYRADNIWNYHVWNFHGAQMGGTGNTTHQFYIEGRPNSNLYINNIRIDGANDCSAIKTICKKNKIRNSLISAVYDRSDVSVGNKASLLLDAAGCAEITVYNNHFVMYGAKVGTQYQGLQDVGALFWRNRQSFYGSDCPDYPNLSWDPPLSSPGGESAPLGFTKGPETFVNPAFWAAVKAKPITDPTNPYSFKKYVSFNKFEVLPSSNPKSILRDDGTHPIDVTQQFGPSVIRRTHPDWVERSVSFMFGNTTEGVIKAEKYDLNNAQYIVEVHEGAKWPRSKPEEFPQAVDVLGELPEWFKI